MILLSVVLLLGPPVARAQEPITLEQAVGTALAKNPALKAAQEETEAARAQTNQARAALYPRVDFSQGFTRGNNPVYVFGTLLMQRQFTAANFALSTLNTPTPLDNFQTRLEGQMLLFDWGRTRQRIGGAKRMETAAEFEAEQARQDLILRVVRAYYGVVVARENLAAAREAYRTAEANEARVRSLAAAGLVVSSDLLSAQVFRAQMKDREIRADNQLQLARMMLSNEMGLGPEPTAEPVDRLEEAGAEARAIDEWERIALAERPALRAAVLRHQAAEKNRSLARAEFGPRVGLFANFERDAETLGGSSGTNWTAGARLEINLFEGGADRYRLAEANARERQASNQVDWFRSGVRLEVRQAYLEMQAAKQRVEAARGSAEQAGESLRILQNRYDAGLATMTDLLRGQTAALEARTGYLAALYDWHVALAQLERTAGKLTEDSKLIRRTVAP
jgi:TolC family type I secretion outer membrane protein